MTLRTIEPDPDWLSADNANSEADRLWFEAHPGRRFYARRTFPGEHDPNFGSYRTGGGKGSLAARGSDWTIVHQVVPGRRIRLGVVLRPGSRPLDGEPERRLAAIFGDSGTAMKLAGIVADV